MNEAMGEKGRQSKDPFELDQLLAEMESLQAQLSEHQRSMAILFTDLKGFTAIFGQLGDADGLLAVQRSESLIRPIVSSHSGTVIKTIGDAVMAHFPAANEAVRAAMAIQHAVVEHNVGVPPEKQIALRMGINVGKGYVKGRDIFGQVVNIAAKVQSAAEAGQILASQVTVQALEPELAKRAEESDPLKVPGLAEPVKTYQILWKEEIGAATGRPAVGVMEDRADPHPSVTMVGENPFTQRILGSENIEITSFPFRVGRDPRVEKRVPEKLAENDLYLEDVPPFRLSREHFQIEREERGYLVRDRGSKLGLFVNGRGIGGEHLDTTQKLVRGVNLLVLGDSNSPYRFLITV